jgi:hypothetical protein
MIVLIVKQGNHMNSHLMARTANHLKKQQRITEYTFVVARFKLLIIEVALIAAPRNHLTIQKKCLQFACRHTQPENTPHSIQHSTAQHSTAQHSTAQHSTAQHSTAQHSTA